MGHEGHDHDGSGHEHSHGAHDASAPDGSQPSHASHAPTAAHGRTPAHAGDAASQSPSRSPGDELEAGAGRGKLLFLDAPSGLAGDMIVAALVDLGVPPRAVEEALGRLPMTGFHVHFGTRARNGVAATSFDVHVDGAQPPRTYASIREMLAQARLDDGVRSRAHRAFERLAAAEAKVHRVPVDDVHFHEVGAVDSIADVVGAAAALAHLGAELVVSPLPMGKGFARMAHGVLPLPAPATVECLAGLDTYDAGIDFELVTPTGAALVGALASGSSRWPSMTPERTGWGAGTADLTDRPNVLRAVLGRPVAVDSSRESASHTLLEANVDDATGELAALWIDALLAAGAVDAWITPIVMKKGRPAMTISALAPAAQTDAVARAMLHETTSLGVRRHAVARLERPRRIESVDTPYGPIPVKVSGGPFGPPQVKPEFEACVRAAQAHGLPVREVLRAATVAAETLAKRAG